MNKPLTIVLLALALVSCGQKPLDAPTWETDDPIAIESPTPARAISGVSLNEWQKEDVKKGNQFAIRLLQRLYEETEKDVICSPLSLQYALAMTASGAKGETAQEIYSTLGYGCQGDALNAYSRALIEQLPAVDLDVTLKLADALVVNKRYPLKDSFRRAMQGYYYAAVENMDFSDPNRVLNRINEWASRNTEGLINPLLEDVDPTAVAYLMNALYFKAAWQKSGGSPMFVTAATREGPFYRANGTLTSVPYMSTCRKLSYAEWDDFRVVALPYASGKYQMYILMPTKADGLEALLQRISDVSWWVITRMLSDECTVNLRLPKFELDGKYTLNATLQALGINRAFSAEADFSEMFENPDLAFCISRVLQKAKITVAEWGTEAATVTVVEMKATSAMPEQPVEFTVDHPFAFFIAEQTSGAILFEGVYTGK